MKGLFFNHSCDFLMDNRTILDAHPLYELKVATAPYSPVLADFSGTVSEDKNIVCQFQLKAIFKVKNENVAIYALVAIEK